MKFISLLAVFLLPAAILPAQNPASAAIKKPYSQSGHPAKGRNAAILYRGGAVMTGAKVNIYLIYYGEVPLAARGSSNCFYRPRRVRRKRTAWDRCLRLRSPNWGEAL